MRLIRCIYKNIGRFLQHLSQEYAHPSFYAAEAREAQREKEQTCCEIREIINRKQLF